MNSPASALRRALAALVAIAALGGTGGGAGQGQGRGLSGELDLALFRRGRARLLQGAEHRDRDGAVDRRPAQRRRDDHQPDRRLRGAGHDRGHERQHQEAGRRHVHLGQQPEQDLPDGAVRRPQGIQRDLPQGPQGRQDHVGARSGQRHHGEGGARGGRPQGRRLQHRSTGHGPARQRHDGGHLRRRLYARAQCLDHAQARRRHHDRSRRHRHIMSWATQCQRLRRRLRAHHRLHQESARRGAALHRRLGESRAS